MPPVSPPSLATQLSGIASRRGWQSQLHRHRLFLCWDRLVGTEISAHARPVRIVRDVLWIEAANSAWMHHLQLQKILILEEINSAQPASPLADIRLTLAVEEKRAASLPSATVRFHQPSPAARESFQSQIAGIKDEKIRESLMGLWYQFNSCQKG